jgi:hypothetical protein
MQCVVEGDNSAFLQYYAADFRSISETRAAGMRSVNLLAL